MFSKHMAVTELLLLDKLASEIIASQADFTLGFCKLSALTCSRGISLTNPELYCRKTFSHSAAIQIKFSQGFHRFPLERESIYSLSSSDSGLRDHQY